MATEAYPAAQLEHWMVRRESRAAVIYYLSKRIELGQHAATMKQFGDALYAVICSFAAIAAATGDNASAVARGYPEKEGWIAVSP
jgi:hypothetical protein